MNSKEITHLLIRLMLGITYLTAGLSKLSPDNIGNIIGPVKMEQIFDTPPLALFFQFVAIYQTITGALILSQRYSVIGLILLFPLSTGILLFTIIAGFGLTPIINLILLLLLVVLMSSEKKTIISIMKFNFKSISQSISFQHYHEKRNPIIAFSMIALFFVFIFLHNIILNFIITTALIFFTLNLFQRKDYLLLDKILLGLFFVISFIIINGILLNKLIPKIFYSVFLLIPLGLLLYITRILYWKFSVSGKNKKQSIGS